MAQEDNVYDEPFGLMADEVGVSDTKVAVDYIRVSIDTLLNGGTNCLFKSVNLFV